MATVKVQQVQRVNRKRQVSAMWVVERKNNIIGTVERTYHGPKCYLALRQGLVFAVCSTRNRAIRAIAS